MAGRDFPKMNKWGKKGEAFVRDYLEIEFGMRLNNAPRISKNMIWKQLMVLKSK